MTRHHQIEPLSIDSVPAMTDRELDLIERYGYLPANPPDQPDRPGAALYLVLALPAAAALLVAAGIGALLLGMASIGRAVSGALARAAGSDDAASLAVIALAAAAWAMARGGIL